MQLDFVVIDDDTEFIQEFGREFVNIVDEAIAIRGVAHVALTGGTMGIRILTGIPEWQNLQHVHFWFSDERFVDSQSPDLNANQAQEALFSCRNIDPSHIHRSPSSDLVSSVQEAAVIYGDHIVEALSASHCTGLDLTLLGLGPDTHVASLFPDHKDSEQQDVVIAIHDSPKPPPLRVSLSYKTINESERVWLIAKDSAKAAALSKVISPPEGEDVPGSRVNGRRQTLVWTDNATLTFGAED